MFGLLHLRLALFIGSYCHGTPEEAFLFDIALSIQRMGEVLGQPVVMFSEPWSIHL